MATQIVIPGEVAYKKSQLSALKSVLQQPTAPASTPSTAQPAVTPAATATAVSPTYQNILANRYGGNAQAYANEIKAKETAGTAFSNPQAAAAFKAANPQYFGQAGAAPAQKSGGPVPEGYVGLRQFFEGMGDTVTWDPSGTITAGDMTFAPGSYKNVGGTAYLDPSALGTMLLGQKAEKPTPENMDEYTNTMKGILQPLYDANKSALQTALNNLNLEADTSRRNVDLAYQQGEDTLASNELSDKKNARRSALSRGIYASGTYDANRSEVDNFYLGEQNKLGQNRAANMANVESSLAQASATNLGQLQTLEAGYLTDVGKSALDLFNTGQAQNMQRNSALATALFNQGQQNYQEGRDKVTDERWAKEFNLSEKQYNSEKAYEKLRDAAGDVRWNKEFNLKTAPSLGTSEEVVQVANASAASMLGTPYKLGGTGSKGIDCSAYVSKVLNDAGLAKGRYTSDTIDKLLVDGTTGPIEVFGYPDGWAGKGKQGHVWIKITQPDGTALYYQSSSSKGVTVSKNPPSTKYAYHGIPASLAAKTGDAAGNVPDTEAGRQKLATSNYYEKGLTTYDTLRKQGSAYPLYDAIMNMLTVPDYIGPAITSGADIKTAVDSLITTKTGKSVDAYLKDRQGSKLAELYYSKFPKKNATAGKPLSLALKN